MDFSDNYQEWVRPPDWESLPTVVLVKIFHFLPLQQRLSARYVYTVQFGLRNHRAMIELVE